MHIDEVQCTETQVRTLLAAQFPQWNDLAIVQVDAAGTDNALYRLGQDKVVRLPRLQTAAEQVDKEHAWLPKLAASLTLPIPVPLAKGEPGKGYPWRWSVYRWLEGKSASVERVDDLGHAAVELGRFILALQRVDPVGGPPPGPHNSFRGAPLATRDSATRAAISALSGMIDTESATAAWSSALKAPAWDAAPVWIHGDLQPGNLLTEHGRLSAVIDFGCMGVGDPACDLMVAWTLFSAESRKAFRATLQVDDATWARGRGWALSFGLIALPYYRTTNPILAAIARYAIDEVLAAQRL